MNKLTLIPSISLLNKYGISQAKRIHEIFIENSHNIFFHNMTLNQFCNVINIPGDKDLSACNIRDEKLSRQQF